MNFTPHPIALIILFTIGAVALCVMLIRNRKKEIVDDAGYIYPLVLMGVAIAVFCYLFYTGDYSVKSLF